MSNPRESAFIPLAPAAVAGNHRSELSVIVLPQAENAQPFRPLGQIKAPSPAPDNKGSSEPRVTVQRDGDRVSGIHVHCSCGQTIELACVYEPPAR